MIDVIDVSEVSDVRGMSTIIMAFYSNIVNDINDITISLYHWIIGSVEQISNIDWYNWIVY